MCLDLAAAEQAFYDNFEYRGENGASISVWQDGHEVLSLASGFRDRKKTAAWSTLTPVLVWSATKGPAAACVLHALEVQSIPIETKVVDVWPEFGAAGKAAVTIGQVLSHQAGLAALETDAEATDYRAVIAAIEQQAPLWPPGSAQGYHPRIFGYLADEIVRRVTGGTSLGVYWRRVFGDPLQLDFWIGAPEQVRPHVAPVFPARLSSEAQDPEFYEALADQDSLTFRAFASPRGLHSVASMNEEATRAASLPGFGGIGTAAALAKFYAMLAVGGDLHGHAFFDPAVIRLMTEPAVSGPDLVLRVETSFSAGFMKDPVDASGVKRRRVMGPSISAFGHPGAGGSLAFADPENGVAFAYVMNQMEACVLPNEKSLSIVRALYA